jgi:hypothetical protein
MSSLVEFVQRLYQEGEVVLKAQPQLDARQRAEAVPVLESIFADYRLAVAGPLIEFDAMTAVAASELLWQACWFLVSRQEPVAELNRCLSMARRPTTPAQHLSGDLLFRYLPQVHRRSRARAADDELAELLTVLLREWPLSGVLADIAEAPLTPLDFGGHPGLLLLYAERLAQKERPAWIAAGSVFEYISLVFHEYGKPTSALLQHQEAEPGV